MKFYVRILKRRYPHHHTISNIPALTRYTIDHVLSKIGDTATVFSLIQKRVSTHRLRKEVSGGSCVDRDHRNKTKIVDRIRKGRRSEARRLAKILQMVYVLVEISKRGRVPSVAATVGKKRERSNLGNKVRFERVSWRSVCISIIVHVAEKLNHHPLSINRISGLYRSIPVATQKNICRKKRGLEIKNEHKVITQKQVALTTLLSHPHSVA